MGRMAIILSGIMSLASAAQANVYQMGSGLTSLEFVPVCDAGNSADDTGYGAVACSYWIGKYEVTNGQYCEFLNAVATTGDPHGLYDTRMGGGWNDIGGIARSGSGTLADPWQYTVRQDRGNRPVNFVTFWDACRFANWLHNGQPTGFQDAGTTEDGSYSLDGVTNPVNAEIIRNPGATIVIPNENEWYKAAYYKGGGTNAGYWEYATQSDSPPTGEPPPGTDATNGSANYWVDGYVVGPPYYTTEVGAYYTSVSAYGTFDQSGNVWEWCETIEDAAYRVTRGGSKGSLWDRLRASHRHPMVPVFEDYARRYGFRVADVSHTVSITLDGRSELEFQNNSVIVKEITWGKPHSLLLNGLPQVMTWIGNITQPVPFPLFGEYWIKKTSGRDGGYAVQTADGFFLGIIDNPNGADTYEFQFARSPVTVARQWMRVQAEGGLPFGQFDMTSVPGFDEQLFQPYAIHFAGNIDGTNEFIFENGTLVIRNLSWGPSISNFTINGSPVSLTWVNRVSQAIPIAMPAQFTFCQTAGRARMYPVETATGFLLSLADEATGGDPNGYAWTIAAVSARHLSSLEVTGPQVVNEQDSADYSCTAHYDDGSTEDVTLLVDWSESSDFADISNTGRLTTCTVASEQQCTVTAELQGTSDSLTVTIHNTVRDLQHVTVAGPTELNEGDSATCLCTAYYDDGTSDDVTATAIWSTESPFAEISDTGELTAGSVIADQECTITAEFQGESDSLIITIKNTLQELDYIRISGATEINEHDTASYVCTAYYDDGTTEDITGSTSWSTDLPLAEISATGVVTVGGVVSNQQCVITAEFQGESDSLIITIRSTLQELDYIRISGVAELHEHGTASYVCTAYYDDGTTENVTGSTNWSTESPLVEISATGVVTAGGVITDQQCLITAEFQGESDSLSLTVLNILKELDHIDVSGISVLNEHDSTVCLCTASYDDGTTDDVSCFADWSSDSACAEVTDEGVVTAGGVVSDQQCTITAAFEGQTDSLRMTIRNVIRELTEIKVTGLAELDENTSANYTCTAYYDDGTTENVTHSAKWSVVETNLAVIDSAGHLNVSCVTSECTCAITAVFEGQTDTLNILINDVGRTCQDLGITGPSELNENSSADYTCTAYYDDETTENVTDVAEWTIDSGHADVTGPGQVTAGPVTQSESCLLTASFEGISGVCHIAIKDVGRDLVKLEVEGPAEVLENSSSQYTCRAEYDTGEAIDVTTTAVWSQDSGFAVMEPSGSLKVSSLSGDQTCHVTAKYSGLSGTLTVLLKDRAEPLPPMGDIEITSVDESGAVVPGGIYVDNIHKSDGKWYGRLSVGTHSISFGYVYGYKIPQPQEVTIEATGTARVDGVYVADGSPVPIPPGGFCFIATAAYGSYLEPEVLVLREFRDQYLLTNSPGRWFVKTYYTYSPYLAAVIAEHSVLRFVTRLVLTPLVLAIEHPVLSLLFLSCTIGIVRQAWMVRAARRKLPVTLLNHQTETRS